MCWHSARRQVCRLLGDIIVLPVVPYHSSAEFPPPQLCWQKELSEHSLVYFQQVRWISQQRGFKLTCALPEANESAPKQIFVPAELRQH